MIKRNYIKNKSLKLCAMFLFPFALFGGSYLIAKPNQASAVETSGYHNESVSVTNSNFENGGTPTTGNNLSGWSAIETESKATGMLIDVGQGENTEGNNDTTIFNKYKDRYMLSSNPLSHGKDSRIMMINSKENSKQKNVLAYKGYKSSAITLEANSNYVFSVSALAMLNDDNNVSGSIYISGITDKNGEDIKIGIENFSNKIWKEYYFFIATGSSSQTVTIDLYLGSAGGATRSSGVVFFDNVNVTRYSQNQFMELCYDFGYVGKDNALLSYDNPSSWDNGELKNLFLVNSLTPDFYLVEGTDKLNFDFEEELDNSSLGNHWQIIPGGRVNGNARILDVRNMQAKDFKNLTGYDNVGDDYSYNNSKALVLWTNSSEYSSGGYVGVKSEDIQIEAHKIYKVSLKMKVSSLEEGSSFYLKVTENDYIYSTYSNLLSSDESSRNYYELQNGKTSGITSNVTNAWTNDYQTISLYIKGHELFNTSVNLELWLGDSSTSALGCVAIDNIKIEKSDYSAFSSASNQFELKYKDSSTENFSNSRFDKSELDSLDGKYPIKAKDWVTEKEDDKLNDSGIIYLASAKEYDRLYKDKYLWAGINPNKDSNPNNVYMMFNKANSYQSITSSSSTLNANTYYKLSFDYFNQFYSSLNESKIKVEVIDENGIILFSKNVQSIDEWSKMEIFIHTPETVSHTVQIKVSLGTKDEKVGGIVYLDNFDVTADDSYKDLFVNAQNKAELNNFYLNLSGNDFSGVMNSPAYSLSVDEVYDPNYNTENCGTVGGLISGKNNGFGITNENNMLFIRNAVAASSTLKTNYKLSLSADSYYELSFDLATFFGEKAGLDSKDHKCKYGFKVTVDGYEAISEIIGDEELKTYKIYYHSTQNSTPIISFTLVSDCENSLGSALITNLNFKTTDEYTYTNITEAPLYKKTIFTAKESAAKDDDNNTDDDNTGDSNSSGINSKWLLASSLIMGLALVIAIIGFALRKVKIKKIDKIKKETYDRKMSKDHDIILAQAQEKRDSEVKDLQAAKSRLVEEKQNLEQAHKEYVKDQRENSNGKLSRAVEAEFKKFNSSKSKLEQKISILDEKISYCMTADYLLTLQRKIVMEEDEKISAERKARKKQQKLDKNN